MNLSLTLTAHAKVNLTLEVLSKRPDGYHEVASVLQTISLADTLDFELSEELELRSSVSSLESADNLVLKAARLLQEASGCHGGASITLTKRIPIAAGLGSGATDAAATLVGLSRLWGLDIPPQDLLEQAAKLGSDVAFFLHGGTALATGRGEKVTPLPRAPCSWLVLLSPPTESIPNKTAKLYSQLEPSHFTSGQYTERLVDRLRATGDLPVPMLFNTFEQVAFTFFAGLSDYRTRLMQAGARRVHLAGSGPSLFVLVQNEIEGKAIVNTLGARGIAAFLACTVDAPLLPPLGDRPC